MFKKREDYSMDTLKERIGHDIIHGDQNLDLWNVQNHRVYK
ncbi:hypothetical protein L915_00235 [Phytophthora nicotianae]|uniref:RxLR effector protein n=1 Tax=Phytophthora nicotianae TaxID=4792 RepID=W2HRV5_PHYNI|nr:hypothetical protein L915_00235 [Phytophthora nicotianae]ETL50540.1 hypothetical protein L916_00238 [Phytophthora nicotianae]